MGKFLDFHLNQVGHPKFSITLSLTLFYLFLTLKFSRYNMLYILKHEPDDGEI